MFSNVLTFVLVMASTGEKVSEVQILLDAQTVALLSGLVIPVLVGLISKISASSGLKAVLNALLSAVAGTLAAFSQDGFFQSDLRTVVLSIGVAWLTSVASYYGLYKPTGVAGTIAAKTANFGIGSPPIVETPDKGAEDTGDGVDGPGPHRR